MTSAREPAQPGPVRPLAGARLVAAAVATTLAVLAIYAFGLYARQVRYETVGGDQMVGSFWMESAQRFRYVRLVAEGREIPVPDLRMEAPSGYDPRSDTLVQEWIYGKAYRAFGFDPSAVPVEKFVRRITPVVWLLTLFPLLGVLGVLCDRRVAALVGCFALAASLPAAERSVGQVLYREHVGIPLLVFHLFFLLAAVRHGRTRDAALSGLFLTLALMSWKVLAFYAALLALFFAVHLAARGAARTPLAPLAWAWVLPVAASVAFPVSLRYDVYATHPASLLAGATLAVGVLDRRRDRGAMARGALVAALFALPLLAFPRAPSYDHAWETLAAKLAHLGRKPADPSALPFHARHFWSGNYASPTPWRFVRDFALPSLLGLPGLAWLARRARSGADPAASLFLFLAVSFLAAWAAFYKLQALPALALSVAAGLSWAAPPTRGLAPALLARRVALALGLAALAAGTVRLLPEPDVLLGRPPDTPRYRASLGHTHDARSLGALADWLRARTARDDVILADFALSPFLLAYVDRPTVMHCFFESPMVERYREYTLASFADEATFSAFARGHDARWVVRQAHEALRDDPEMSYRYVADRLAWDPASAAARLHYDPDGLSWFRLAFEDDFFRVYEVLDRPRAAGPSAHADPAHVLWSRAWTARRCGADPLAGPAFACDLARGLYDLVWSRGRMAVAGAFAAAGLVDRAADVLVDAGNAVPDDPGPWRALADLAERAGRPADAASARTRADAAMPPGSALAPSGSAGATPGAAPDSGPERPPEARSVQPPPDPVPRDSGP